MSIFYKKFKKIKLDRIFINIIYLFVLRVSMYLFPLITMPYLVRVLGIANYGVLSLIQTISSYFVLFINYGFNLSGPRDIAVNKENNKELNNIFCNVICIKLLLFIISIPFLLIVGLLIPITKANYSVYLLLLITLISEVIYTNWFFQGIERLRLFTLISLFSRLISLILLLIFVKKANDLFLAYLIISGSSLLGSIISFIIIKIEFKFKFFFPDLITIKTQLQKGWDLFVAQGATTLFSNSNIFIIGLLLTPEQVGLYSIAERIMRTVASMVAPVSNALYPVSAKLFKKSNDVAIKYLKKFLFIGSLVFMLAGVGMVVFSNVIVLVMTGEENIEIQYLLLIMAFIPLSIYINNIYGTQIMLNLYLEKVFKYLIITNGISLPVLSYILTLNFNLWGASFSLLITEILLTVSVVVYVEFIKKQGFLGVLKK